MDRRESAKVNKQQAYVLKLMRPIQPCNGWSFHSNARTQGKGICLPASLRARALDQFTIARSQCCRYSVSVRRSMLNSYTVHTHTQNKNKPHQAYPNRIAYVIFPQNVKNAKCIKCIGAQTIYQKNAHSTIHNSKHLLHSLIQCTAFVRSRPIININLFPQSKFDVLLINRV